MAGMSTPTRQGRVPGGASFSNLMLTPKLAMPTASPQVTRLDRVLDLVTEHEAHFREQELRIVDISKRVTAVEESCDRELAPLREFDIRAELEAAKLAVDRLHHQMTLVSGEQEAIRAELHQAMETSQREHHETRVEHERQLSEMKAGFKAVLQDVVDRVASQLDAMRKSEFERAEQYASNAELTALAERVAAHERDAEAYAQQQKQSLALALAQVEGMQAERDKMKRRVNKLTAFYNNAAQSGSAGGGSGGDVNGGGIGGIGSDMGLDDASGSSVVDRLVARLDQQAHETSDLRTHYELLSGKLERAQAENVRLTEKMRAQRHAFRDVERHVSERAQDMSELMSQIGNVVHVQGRAVQAAAATSSGGGGGGGGTAPSTPSLSATSGGGGGGGIGGHHQSYRGRSSPPLTGGGAAVSSGGGLGSAMLNMGYGAYASSRLAAGHVGGFGAAVEKHATQAFHRIAEAEHATSEFDRFLDKMKRRIDTAAASGTGADSGTGAGTGAASTKEKRAEGSGSTSRRERSGGRDRDRKDHSEKEKRRSGEGDGDRKHRRHHHRSRAEDST